MKTSQYLLKSVGFLFLFFTVTINVSAQFGFGVFPSTTTVVDTPRQNLFNQNNTNSGINPTNSSGSNPNQLPNYQQRIEQLKQLGISEQEIQDYITKLKSGQNPPTPTPPAPTPTPKPTPTPAPVTTVPEETKVEEPERPTETMMTFDEFLKKNGGVTKKGNQIEIEKTIKDKIDISRADSILKLVWNNDSSRYDSVWFMPPPKKKERPINNYVFGHDFFLNKNVKAIADTFSISPPDDYVIQAGDEFGVSAWNGTSMTSDNLLVESDGSVSRQYVGRKFVAGMTYKDARNMLENAYRSVLPNGAMLRVRLSKSVAKISVNIVGEVKNPGTFIMSNYSTLLNALMMAGGITDLATVRNIYVKRDGKQEEVLDLYSLIIDGKMKPIYLKNNDYIFVPMQGDIVSITGFVKRPRRYEMKEGEDIGTLLRYAGGVRNTARTSNVKIKRLYDGQLEEIDVNLKTSKSQRLQDGDVVQVDEATAELLNVVEVRGQVYYPNSYQFRQGMRVKDLIELGGGLQKNAELEKAYIVRMPKYNEVSYIPISLKNIQNYSDPANIVLQPLDQLIIFNADLGEKNKTIEIRGEVYTKGTFKIAPKMTLKDVLYLANGLKPHADYDHIELGYFKNRGKEEDPNYGLKEGEQEDAYTDTKTRRIAIKEDWKNDPALDTIFVDKYRYVQVYSRFEDYKDLKFKVQGSVKKAKTIPLTPTLTLKDVLFLVGGFAPDADYDHLELGYYTYSGDANKDPNYKLEQEKGDIPMTEITDIRRFAINPNWKDDPTLDTIFLAKYRYLKVYSRYDDYIGKTFTVRGAVNKSVKIPLTVGLSLKDVLYLAGGPAENADYDQVELGYYTYSGGEKDPNLNITFDNGQLRPYTEIGIRRFKLKVDWKNDPSLDTIMLAKYRYFHIYPLETYEDKQINISGAVKNPRTIQLNATLNLRDALFLCGGPEKDADLDHVELSFFQNIEATNADSLNLDAAADNQVLRHIAIRSDWRTDSTLDTILLKNYRYMKVYSKSQYRWKREVSVRGVVESPKTLLQVKGMTLKDVLYLCGGLRRDEEDYYIIDLYEHFRQQDVGSLNLKPHERKITRIVVEKNWWKDTKIDSMIVTNYDEIIVHSQNEFYYEGFAEVKGLVKSPGRFKVQPKMSLKDVLYRAGGVPMETDFANIEISRVLKIENTNGDIIVKPVKIKKYAISQDWRNDKKIDSVFIYAFDQIFIRPNYDFKLQKNVFIEGEIKTPGEYSKISPTERLSSLVKRANGLTPESFAAGAKLSRVNLDATDTLVIQLDKALRYPRSKYDIILKEGDRLSIPTIDPTVRVKGNVLVPNTYVTYDKRHKSFLYYINLAGGFGKRTQHNECRVLYANGMSKGTKRVLFVFNVYPPILAGSTLIVPQKPEKDPLDLLSKQQFGTSVKELTADIASVLSLVALMRAITR